MNEPLYDYPQSSCSCCNCENRVKYPLGYKSCEGKTNTGIQYCDLPAYYECFNTSIFSDQIEPSVNTGKYTAINPQAIINKRSRQYDMIDPKNCPNSQCGPHPTFVNSDSRLRNNITGQVMQLDIPPITGNEKLAYLPYDKSLNGYGQRYKGYSDIEPGQIMYYNDEQLDDVLFKPLFSSKAQTISYMYKDPMTNTKPAYWRVPPENTPCEEYSCLSFMKDTQFQREDILSRQMATINQQRWLPRWEKKNYFT